MFWKQTGYHRLTVSDAHGVRSLRFDNRRQSALELSDGFTSDIAYTDYLHLALTVQPEATRSLVIGLGGGALPKRMWRDYPSMSIDVVEIDPMVVEVARRFFELPEDDRLRLIVDDGRRFVETTDERYDLVFVDAYFADSIPHGLATVEFFREVRRVLAPNGAMAYNLIATLEGRRASLFRSFLATVESVWPHVRVFAIGLAGDFSPHTVRNIVLLASGPAVPDDVLLERIEGRLDGRVSVPGFEDFAADLYLPEPHGGDVLRDADAPEDGLIHLET